MRRNRNVKSIAFIAATVLVTACVPLHQTTTLSSTKFFKGKEAERQRTFADAYLYGEAVKDNYAKLKRRQENFRRDSAVAVIAAGATTLFYTVTGGASQDVLTGTAVGGAGLYLTADVLTDRLEQEVFQLGYEGVNCVLSDYSRLYDADAALARYVSLGTGSSKGLIDEAKDDLYAELLGMEVSAEIASEFVSGFSPEAVIQIQNARISVALSSTSVINRVDSVQNQVEEQRAKIGSDPLTAARNPFQLVLNRANQFSGTPITVPEVDQARPEDKADALKNKLTSDSIEAKALDNETQKRDSSLLAKIAHLQAVIAEAVSILSVLEKTIEEGPGKTACNIPDQSGQLALKTQPAELSIPNTQAAYQIVITDPRIQAVQASWAGNVLKSGASAAAVVPTTQAATYTQPATVTLNVDNQATAGTYSLYIADTSGRFANTIKVEVK